MKKLYTMIVTATMATLAYGAVETPVLFSENFVSMEQQSDYPIDGWTTYGNGAVPASSMTDYFGSTGDGPVYLLLRHGDKCYAMSCTNFNPATAADQWLITPPIEITDDAMELTFTGAVYCNAGNWGLGRNPVKVLVSTDGPDHDAFSEVPVYEGTVNGTSASDVSTKVINCPLNGYAGKTVHLAFVSTGEDLGMTGFTDIQIGNYAVTFDNKTPQVADAGESVTIDLNVGMKTPVACAGFTAVLTAGDETQTRSYTKAFGGSGTSLLYQRVTFDPIELGVSATLNYTVTVTPNYEGAPASVLTGAVGLPTVSYVNNVVIEELTATGCQACPSGAASMEYYHDIYPVEEGKGRVIPIAIHGNINYADPMNEGVEDYVASTIDRNGTSSYPQAIFNRSSRGLMPDRRQEVAAQMELRSYNHVSITGIDAPDADNPWGKELTVHFDVRNAYDAESRQLTAAAVMLEDNVRGNTSGYVQTNGFYNRDASYVTSAYGDFLVPYMTKYLAGGELGVQYISFDKMVYQHVARCIEPSYAGEPLSEAWIGDEPKACELTFTVPETVIDFANTSVVVLVMDESGDIVASDVREFANYGDSGVDEVTLPGVSARRDGMAVVVTAPENAEVRVVTMTGLTIGTANGSARIETGVSEPVVVLVNTPAGNWSAKI